MRLFTAEGLAVSLFHWYGFLSCYWIPAFRPTFCGIKLNKTKAEEHLITKVCST